MLVRRLISSLALVATAAACDRRSAPVDSASVDATATDTAWVAELGPMLLIQGDSEPVALALNDGNTGARIAVRLARPGAAFAPAVPGVIQEADSIACGGPRFRLDGRVPGDWTLGVVASDVSAVPLDSIEALPAADSAALAADVSRVAAALAPPESRLRGLPFVVVKAYRTARGDRSTFFATVLRRLPLEANPLEARGFVIAERAGQAAYSLAYGLRSEGSEETVEHFALLGVVRVGDKEFAVLERERDSGTRYEILERGADGGWRVRWSRALDC